MVGKIGHTNNYKHLIKVFLLAWLTLCSSNSYSINPYKNFSNSNINTKEKTYTENNKDSISINKNDNEKTLIYLEHTELISFDNDKRPDIQVLIGNVIFRHDSVYLYCDSAYLNQKTNSFDAFGNVKIEQGDTIDIFSKLLHYNGDTKVAKLYKDVKMINDDVTLLTDTLTYNRNSNIAFYTCGGIIKDTENTLVSEHGYYNANTKLAEFKYNVVGKNNSATIESDTLTYNTDNNIAAILGPTIITHTDSTTVYSEKGWYNSNTDCSELLKNSVIRHRNDKSLEGDTIFYDKNEGIGKAYSNVILTDSTNFISLHGNYGYYIENGEIGLITDSAMMTEYSQKDTVYIHGDTLYSYAVDSSKMVLAYHNVRLFHPEYQGVCDSLTFCSKDSILHLISLPIIWTENQQINGDTIHIYPKNGDVDRMHIVNNAMMVQKEDSIHYNQISGKEITAYLTNQELDYVKVEGNAESIFFPVDQGNMIGMNSMQSSYMNIYFKNGKLERINIFPSPTASLYPMSQIREDMLYLHNFSWQIEARPLNKNDIFNRPKRVTKAELDERKKQIKEQEQEERKNKRKNKKNKDITEDSIAEK